MVANRTTPEGEPLDAALVTKHLRFSLPYRALFSRRLDPDLEPKLLDALAELLVRLHLVGFRLERLLVVEHAVPPGCRGAGRLPGGRRDR